MEKTKCARCGNEWETNKMIISSDDEGLSFFCPKCSQFFGQCPFCENYPQCGFEHDPDPMPQFVMVSRRVQQGNMTFVEQKQFPNTARLRKFCLDGKCKCCNEDDPKDPFCCRFTGFGTCANFTEKKFEKFVQNFSMDTVSEN